MAGSTGNQQKAKKTHQRIYELNKTYLLQIFGKDGTQSDY